jgi:hypothetical protein
MIINQLLKKFLLCETQKVHHYINKSQLFGPIQSHFNPVRTPTSCYLIIGQFIFLSCVGYMVSNVRMIVDFELDRI